MTSFLEFGLPFTLVAALFAARWWRDINWPRPVAFGCIIPDACVVNSDEILSYHGARAAQQNSMAAHLRRQARRKQARVDLGFIEGMIWNTRLFQRAVRFERGKIDQAKSSLDYEQRETLILQLVGETAAIRRQLVARRARLTWTATSGLRTDKEALMDLLGPYKTLEHDIIALLGMGEDPCYREMMIDRLGLKGWRLMDGGEG